MLTLTVVSDGAPEDAQTAVSLAYNSGLAVKVVGKDGKDVGTVSAVAAKEDVEPTPEVAPEATPEVEVVALVHEHVAPEPAVEVRESSP